MGKHIINYAIFLDVRSHLSRGSEDLDVERAVSGVLWPRLR